MNRKLIIAVLGTLLVLAIVTMSKAADFSADLVQNMGSVQMKGKINISGANARTEAQMGSQKLLTIVRGDRGVVYLVNPAGKSYSEMRIPKQRQAYDVALTEKKLASMATIKKLGSEKVNGYVCEKTLFTFKDKKRGTMTTWVSKKLGYPVKTETISTAGKFAIQLNNIKIGKQPASLFEVPSGFKKTVMQRPVALPQGTQPNK